LIPVNPGENFFPSHLPTCVSSSVFTALKLLNSHATHLPKTQSKLSQPNPPGYTKAEALTRTAHPRPRSHRTHATHCLPITVAPSSTGLQTANPKLETQNPKPIFASCRYRSFAALSP
jgi:hypothetical protein